MPDSSARPPQHPQFSTPEHRRVLSSTTDISSSSPSSSTPLNRTPPSHLTTPHRPSPSQSTNNNTGGTSPTTRHLPTLTLESLLSQHSSQSTALDALLVDRNHLAGQNAQLWKLIERQRATHTTLAKENERLRAERDRALGKGGNSKREPSTERAEKEREKEKEKEKEKPRSGEDSPAGQQRNHALTTSRSLEPLRAGASSSSSPPFQPLPSLPTFDSLASTALPPPPTPPQLIPPPTPTSSTSGPTTRSATPSPSPRPSPISTTPPALPPPSISVTPTPISPSDPHPSTPPPLPTSLPTDDTPRPASRPSEEQSPPPTTMVIPPTPFIDVEPPPITPPPTLPAPRAPSPAPSGSTTGSGSGSAYITASSTPFPSSQTLTQLNIASSSHSAPPPTSQTTPRLTPPDLPRTTINISHSTIRPNDRGKDVLSFHILVYPPSPDEREKGKERERDGESDRKQERSGWAVEKLYSDVLALDARLRQRMGRSALKRLGVLPEGKAFRDHAPVKVDQRKAALSAYLQALLTAKDVASQSRTELCVFFTSDVTRSGASTQRAVAREGYKEGYLTKRGKNFGGWKTRYFVLQSNVLEYYESRGGTHLGSITLTGAQIGRQQRQPGGTSNSNSSSSASNPTSSSDSQREREREEDENAYRHAFLIIEARRSTAGQPNRHVLCAESDRERDSWVEHLVRYVVGQDGEGTGSVNGNGNAEAGAGGKASIELEGRSSGVSSMGRPRVRTTSKDAISRGLHPQPISQLVPDAENAKLFQAAPPPPPPPYSPTSPTTNMNSTLVPSASLPDVMVTPGQRSTSALGNYGGDGGGYGVDPRAVHSLGTSAASRVSVLPPPSNSSLAPTPSRDDTSLASDNSNSSKVKISGPMNGTPIPAGYKFGGSASSTSLAPPSEGNDRERKAKSGRFWLGRLADKVGVSGPSGAQAPPPIVIQSRAVFGVPLTESLEVAVIANLPAVVFRCIEYLEAKHAELEEGIYRLSGSSAVIKGLRDRFNQEGDYNLLASDEYWDLHAVAGLLKGFLRELPTSVLTRELHLRFLAVIDLLDAEERIAELAQLIAALPLPNYSLLRALTAHLILIVQHSGENKMNMRNVGIVFSPTLGIPAGVFSLMLAEFHHVFNVDGDGEEAADDEAEPEEEEDVVEEDAETPATPMATPRIKRISAETPGSRNSRSYADGAADRLLGLAGRSLKPQEGSSDEDDIIHEESGTETENDTDPAGISDEAGRSTPALNGSPSDTSPPTSGSLHVEPQSGSRAKQTAHARGLHLNSPPPLSPLHKVPGAVLLPHSPRPHAQQNRGTPTTSTTPSPSISGLLAEPTSTPR